MEQVHSTTPFGRRPLTLAQVAAQAKAKSRPLDRAVHKWQLFRDICAAKTLLAVSDRELAVLNALLTFHPETVLTGEGLIVFPSNQQLCLRAHGMAESTVRRHLFGLVEVGLILRRDSPNGKRYARKSRAGTIEKAFGFDLAPLVARAEEIAEKAEAVRAEEIALRLVRERISLCRRDIIKMIALGMEERVAGDWQVIHVGFRSIIEGIPRGAGRPELEPVAESLTVLAEDIAKLLEDHANSQKKSGNAGQSERHYQTSNPKPLVESEPRHPNVEAAGLKPAIEMPKRDYVFPLGMVLNACPDLIDYARHGITNWRDFLATVAVIRPMLGISPSAWEEAAEVMGESQAAIVIACILQRSSQIVSAGGYLRDLTRRAREGEFSVGPMLMALLSTKRRREKLRA